MKDWYYSSKGMLSARSAKSISNMFSWVGMCAFVIWIVAIWILNWDFLFIVCSSFIVIPGLFYVSILSHQYIFLEQVIMHVDRSLGQIDRSLEIANDNFSELDNSMNELVDSLSVVEVSCEKMEYLLVKNNGKKKKK